MSSSRRLWTISETRALLTCYGARKNEFQHCRRKKFAYQNIVEDLTSMGILKEPISCAMVENKIKYLIKAYKQAVDNNNSTGNCPAIEPYSDLMEEIFGDGILCQRDTEHVLNVGCQRISIEPLLTRTDNSNEFENIEFLDTDSLDKESVDISPKPKSANHAGTLPQLKDSNLQKLNGCAKKRKSGAQKILEVKIEWDREKEEAKKQRHEDKLKARAEKEKLREVRHKEKMEMQKLLLEELKRFNKN